MVLEPTKRKQAMKTRGTGWMNTRAVLVKVTCVNDHKDTPSLTLLYDYCVGPNFSILLFYPWYNPIYYIHLLRSLSSQGR